MKLIKGGTVVTATETMQADVLIDGEKVVAIASPEHHTWGESAEVVDAAGKLVMPGGVDVHTHMELPFGGTSASDTFESGTRAAAWGGTTTIIDFAVQTYGQDVMPGFEAWMGKADGNCAIDYGFHMIIGDVTEASLKEMDALIGEGVTSFKLFMAYPGVFYSDDGQIFRAMQKASDIGATVMMHAENGMVIDVLREQALQRGETDPRFHGITRPPITEGEATHRAIAIAELAGCPVYIVHMAAKEALAAVAEARDRGVNAFAETCPQYLYFSLEEHLSLPGFEGAKYVCSTPIRSRAEGHQDALWRGLATNDLQVVSTDHCPFCFNDHPTLGTQKQLGLGDFTKIPNGLPAVENRFELIYHGAVGLGHLTVNRFVEVVATTPAKMFGLYPQKGTIPVGSDADIVVFDPDRPHVISAETHHMDVDYSCWEGYELAGSVQTVLSRGRVIVAGGEYLGAKGDGRYLRRGQNQYLIWQRGHLPRSTDDMRRINHWIDGEEYAPEAERVGVVWDPATGTQQAEVALGGPEVVDAAVESAKRALESWWDLSLAKRASIMFRFRDLVEQHADDIARLLTAEHGKVLSDARGEVQRGLEVIEFACGIPQLLKGDFSENVSTGVDSYSIRQPLGVVAGITPFNFPAMVPMWMYPIAIVCGNTFVLKPSEKDPGAPLFAAELFSEAGLPDGVLNVVNGDKAAVDRILEHPDIAAVSFVGSTPIARYIYETATANGKRVQALGGAKNHMVVLPDADMDLAADAVVGAAYGSAGERCMAISVLVTVGGAGDDLLPKVEERIHAVRTAPGTEPDAEMGPLVSPEHRDKVVGYIDAGVEEGATLVTDGRKLSAEQEGFFVGPTLFDDVTPDMSIYRDEIFGPVLSTVRVGTYEEAMDLINANPYANGVAIFTNDGGAARRFQNEVPVGMVGINVPIPVPVAYYSFGGWKSSLFGDSHIYGTEGIHFYTRGKVVTSRWPDPSHRGVNLGFPQNV